MQDSIFQRGYFVPPSSAMTKGVSDGTNSRRIGGGGGFIVIGLVIAAVIPIITQYIINPSSLLMGWLLPHGKAFVNFDHPKFSKVDPNIQNLSIGSEKLTKIYERIGNNAESELEGVDTVFFDDDGTMYALTKGAKLVRLDEFEPSTKDDSIITAQVTVITSLPAIALGAKFVPDKKVLYFTTPLGLYRIDLAKRFPIVELVASEVRLDDGTLSQIGFAYDLDIGPKTGHVYFSDASDISPKHRTGDGSPSSWNVIAIMHAYVLDFLRAKRTGRLLRYDPATNEVQILASGLWFANGVAVVDSEETSLLISESSMARIIRYHITGHNGKTGTTEVLLDSLVGAIDGVDCDHEMTMCYAAIPAPVTTLVKVLFSRFMPRSLETCLRTMMMMLPSYLLVRKPDKYGGFVELSLSSSSSETRITRVFQDSTGENISTITGVTEHEGKVYLGGLYTASIGVYDLDVWRFISGADTE